MAALASAVIVSAPQAKTYADTQANDTQAVTEKLIDNQLANAAQPAEQNNSGIAQEETVANSDEKQNQQESSKLKSEKEINSKKAGFGSQALNHPAQATAVTGLGKEGLGLSEEKTPQAQGAGEGEADKEAFKLNKPIPVGVYDPKNLTEEEIANVKKAVVEANSALKNTTINVTKEGKVTFTDPDGKEQTIDAADTVVKDYGIDEGKIKDYNGSERYRETDLQPGDTNQESNITDQGESKDGLEFNIKNPSADSKSKTEYGYQITIDKETGQRTYTKIYVTDSGRVPVGEGEKPMMGQGDKLTP